MNYEYAYYFEEVLDNMPSISGFGSTLGLISYVFTALAIYTIAQRREIKKAWLAWVPVVNVWILGSISDQYRYVVKDQVKSKRKILLGMGIANFLLCVAVVACMVATGISVFSAILHEVSEEALGRVALEGILVCLAVSVPLAILSIVSFVIRAMALYDLYSSCEPQNNALYLILSLIPGINQVTQPLFLFLCREKDEGMPPRRDSAVPDPYDGTMGTYEEIVDA